MQPQVVDAQRTKGPQKILLFSRRREEGSGLIPCRARERNHEWASTIRFQPSQRYFLPSLPRTTTRQFPATSSFCFFCGTFHGSNPEMARTLLRRE